MLPTQGAKHSEPDTTSDSLSRNLEIDTMIESLEVIRESVAMMIFAPIIAVWIASVIVAVLRLAAFK